MHLSKVVEEYRAFRQISDRTHRDYRLAVGGFERWATKPLDLDELHHTTLNRYLLHLTEDGKSLFTVAGRRTKILVVWRAGCELGLSDNWPDERRIRRIKPPEPNPECWSVEDVRAILAYCESHMRFRLRSVDVPAGDYVGALIGFLHDSGMRIGDAVSMEFDWVLRGVFSWRQSKTSHWHVAKLSEGTLEAIRRIRTDGRRLIWPRRRSDSGALYRLIRLAVAGAGLSGTSRYIRRGGATDVYLSGADPARYCGHVPGSRVAIRWYVRKDAQIAPVSPTEL